MVDQAEGNRNWVSRKTLPMGAYGLSGQSGKRLVIHLDLSEKPRPSRRERRAGGGRGKISDIADISSPNEELQKAECRGYSGLIHTVDTAKKTIITWAMRGVYRAEWV